ncbi:NB-ARC domain-containing protein [Frankia canadensis]|uniref:NB-ARC domain-containing protein n=1 Tax=Frankia canadensis TaxID=1836972 RepID=A0A2I2KJE4_9ACTN|nr:tetratricopeptide repeat protein [Frankia canadensis]SNQ45783.1 NB-ARC domain-containing protein [Frankia canadensis]SOU53073.1 NB-ARC domain-containing protein [Frankia canadensis]
MGWVDVSDALLRLDAPRPVFVNRFQERAAFLELVDWSRDERGPLLIVVSGPQGVGKSQAVLRWVPDIGDRFDGGQFRLDLADLAQRDAVDVTELLERIIAALGGDPYAAGGSDERERRDPGGAGHRPAGRRDRLAGMLARRIAGRRLVIVLDGVLSAAQALSVRDALPLLAGCVVIVVSARRFPALVRAGGREIVLGPLSDVHSAELIGEYAGPDWLRREPEAAAEVIRYCGGLPLLLELVGVDRQMHQTRRVSTIADQTRDIDRRLDYFVGDSGERVIEVTLEGAYWRLPEGVRTVYRMLGVHPGTSCDAGVLAAGLRRPLAGVRTVLDSELVLAHLIGADEDVEGRYQVSDLVQSHARRRAELEDEPADRDSALGRMVGVYLRHAMLADRAVIGSRMRLVEYPPPAEPWWDETVAPPAPSFGSAAEALRWFEANWAALLGAVRAAARRRWDLVVVLLADAMWAYFLNRKRYGDWAEVCELAVEAAVRLGDAAAEARMRSLLGRAFYEQGRYEQAHAQFDAALPCSRGAADRRMEASVLEFSGRAYLEQGVYSSAIALFERAREINLEIGNARGVALQSHHLGRALRAAGRAEEAARVLRDALDGFTAIGDEHNRGRVLLSFGEALLDLREDGPADGVLREAEVIMRRRAIPFQVALVLRARAVVASRAGDAHRWESCLREAFETFAAVGSPLADRVRRQLDDGFTGGDSPAPS